MRHWGWRSSFFLSGAIGALVAVICYMHITDRPDEHPDVNAGELSLIRGSDKFALGTRNKAQASAVPWGRILSSPSVVGLMISHFCLVYPVYIFFTWFFIYLVRVRGITVPKASFWTSAPFVANLIMVPLWGWLSDRAAEKYGKRWGRRATAWLGIAASAVLLWTGVLTTNNTWALLQLALAAGFNFAASSVLWTTCNDISASFSGSISGIMTTLGSLGGWLSPVLTAAIATKFGWSYALDFAGIITILSGVAWFFIEPDKLIV
jgi:sugar phosphate permease